MSASTRLRQILLTALSSDHPGEVYAAVQKAKAEMAKNGHGDIHVIAEHIEGIGKEIVPDGYCSPEELQRRVEVAAAEAMQRGRELERLSKGQSPVNWYDVALECLGHRQLQQFVGHDGTMKYEREFVEKIVRMTELGYEPSPKEANWLRRIHARRRV
jgi:hypothetical protein